MRALFPRFLLVVFASRGAFAQDRAPVVTGSIHTPTVRFALERAARAALERLERPECRRVLSDLSSSGRCTDATLLASRHSSSTS